MESVLLQALDNRVIFVSMSLHLLIDGKGTLVIASDTKGLRIDFRAIPIFVIRDALHLP